MYYRPFIYYFIEHDSEYEILNMETHSILNMETHSIVLNYKIKTMNITNKYKFYAYNTKSFINNYIEMLKEEVFKKYPNIQLFKIQMKGYNGNDNIVHKLFRHAIEYIRNVFHISLEKIDKNSIVIEIFYDNKLIHVASVSKSYLYL